MDVRHFSGLDLVLVQLDIFIESATVLFLKSIEMCNHVGLFFGLWLMRRTSYSSNFSQKWVSYFVLEAWDCSEV
jgi:hypothetical protein